MDLTGIFCTAGASYGKVIGQFKLTSHGVSVTVYAANNVTIVISNFTFDGSSSGEYMTSIHQNNLIGLLTGPGDGEGHTRPVSASLDGHR